eukprot:COSAG01_NODE_13766_length_1524_cov_1.944406_1_plen_78_part_00
MSVTLPPKLWETRIEPQLVRLACARLPTAAEIPGRGGGGGGESFLRVHWVAVPEAMRARRVNRPLPAGEALPQAGSG